MSETEQRNNSKEEDTASPQKGGKKKSDDNMTPLEMVKVIVIALILAVVIKTFVFGTFWIPSESMVPTVNVNDKIITTNFSYWTNGPQRGDIVVFKYPKDTKKTYVKRCIGCPGEVIEFKDSKLYVDGNLVEEPYLPTGLEFSDYGPVLVPEGCYFMCGDNRNRSADSRVWGYVEKKLIIGKAQLVYWPFSAWKKL